MTVEFSLTVSNAAVRGFVAGPVAAAGHRAGGKVRDRAKAELTTAPPGGRFAGPGRVDTGQLRNSGVVETVVEGNRVRTRVAFRAAHAMFQHEGTGVHGPRGAPIVPRRARVLRFRARGQGFIFRPQVSGTIGFPYLTRALEQLRLGDFAA